MYDVVIGLVGRRWFQHPLRNRSVINQRLDTIEFFLNSRNVEVTTSLESCLKSIKHLGVCAWHFHLAHSDDNYTAR